MHTKSQSISQTKIFFLIKNTLWACLCFNLFVISYLLYSAIFTTPIQAQSTCVDSLEYFLDSANDTIFTNDGQAKYEWESPTPINGKSGFYIIKSRNMGVYEEFTYDGQYIYHQKDTSWATENGDVFCTNGAPAGFTMMNTCGATGIDTPQEGAIWIPRQVCDGQSYGPYTTQTLAFNKAACTLCEAAGMNVSCTSRSISVQIIPSITFGGVSFTDVLRVRIDSGPGANENYWYSKENGWIAFGRDDNPRSYIIGTGPAMDVAPDNLSADPTAGGQFACQPFDGFYGAPGPALPPGAPGQMCQYTEITPYRNGQYTSRPIECSTCVPFVPDPVLSCAGNFTYQKNLLYTAFETATCSNLMCGVNEEACAITLGGVDIGSGNASTEQLMVGPKPWRGGFTLDASSVIFPYAGNDTEESREKYIADYVDGTLSYRTTINPASDPPIDSPPTEFDPTATTYFDIPPNDPRFVSYAGIIHKLAPQEYQDEQKYKLLLRVDGTDYASIYQPIKDYTIGYTWGSGDEAHLNDFIREEERLKPLVRNFPDRTAYQEALDQWQQIDGGRWEKLWTYVPLTSRNDTPGEFLPIPQSPSRLQRVPSLSNAQVNQPNTAAKSLPVNISYQLTPSPTPSLTIRANKLFASSVPFSLFDDNILTNTSSSIKYQLAQAGPIAPASDFKVAFFGDTGAQQGQIDVLRLVQRENVDLVVIEGDFNYDLPRLDTWKNNIDTILGANFPILFIQGNHELSDGNNWNNYIGFINQHAPSGMSGYNNNANYQVNVGGINFIGVDERPGGNIGFLNGALNASSSQYIWNICNWHRTNNSLTIGNNRSGDIRLENYQACLNAGAMIINAHEHSYHRTKTLVDVNSRQVDPTCSGANEICLAPGKTYVSVVGLGGKENLHDQGKCRTTSCPEWANIYTFRQGAKFGALFINFNVGGAANQAYAQFKNIDNQVIDEYSITSGVTPTPTPTATPTAAPSTQIRVMSYNAGYDMPNDCGAWTAESAAKVDRVANYIKQNSIQIALLQEFDTECGVDEWITLDQRLDQISYPMNYVASEPDLGSGRGLRTVTFAIPTFSLDQANSRSLPVPRPNSGSRYGIAVPIDVGVGPITFYNIHTHVDTACRGVNAFFSQVNNNERRILGGDFNVAFFEGGFPHNYSDCNQGTVDNVNLYNTQPQPGIDFIMLPKDQPFSFIRTSKDTGSSLNRDHAPVVSDIQINLPSVSITPTPTPTTGKLKVLLYNTERNDAAPGDDDGCTATGSNVQVEYTQRKINTLAEYVKNNQFDILLLQELWHRCEELTSNWNETTLLSQKLQEIGYPMVHQNAGGNLFQVATFIYPSRQNLSFYNSEVQILTGELGREYLLTPIATPLGKIAFFNGHVSHREQQCQNVEDFVNKFANISGLLKVAGGDINNELWRSGCAGVRDNYKLVPTRPDNRGIDFLFIPNASSLNFENTSIENIFDPQRPGTWLSDHQPIITHITGVQTSPPPPGPSTYPTTAPNPTIPPSTGDTSFPIPPGGDQGMGPLDPAATPVQLQLPHVARLFESQRILNDLLAPYDNGTSNSFQAHGSPQPGGPITGPGGPTPPIVPPSAGQDIWVYANATNDGRYTAEIADGLDETYPLPLETPEFQYDRWDTSMIRFAARSTSNITINLPYTPAFAELRSATQYLPVQANGNSVTFSLPPTPGNYYLRTSHSDRPQSTIVIFVDNMDQVGAEAPPGAIVIQPGDDVQGKVDSAGPGSLIFFSAGTYNVPKISFNGKTDINVQLHPEASIYQTASNGSIIEMVNTHNVNFFGPGKIFAKEGNGAVSFILNHSSNINLRDFYHQKREHDNGFTLFIYNSDNINVTNVRIMSGNDGTDPDSSRNVTYDNVYIESKDDGVAVKSRGDGPAENITIRNSIVKSRASALKIGKATISKPVRNIVFENTTCYDSDRCMIVDPDCQWGDGRCNGSVGLVIYRNIFVRTMRCYEQCVTLSVGGSGSFYGPADIRFENIDAEFRSRGYLRPGHKVSINGMHIEASQSRAINGQPPFIYIPQNQDCPRSITNITINDPGDIWGDLTNHGYCNDMYTQATSPILNAQTQPQVSIPFSPTPTIAPVNNSKAAKKVVPTSPVTNGSFFQNLTSNISKPLNHLFASAQIFSPSETTADIPNPDTSNLLAQNVPPACLPANTGLPAGCYPGGGCFNVSIQNLSISGTDLHYCVRAEQSCPTAGNIGDCDWYFNGGELSNQTIRQIPGGAYVCSNGNEAVMPPIHGVGPGSSGQISGYIRCERDIDQNCCNQTQAATCNFFVNTDGSITTDCSSSFPQPAPPVAPVCSPTVLGSVPQCNMIQRPGPGDYMCGLQSFDLLIDAPNETFWNANPYNTQAYDPDTTAIDPPGDGTYEYSSTQCGAAVGCEECTCAEPNDMEEYNCDTTYDPITGLPTGEDCDDEKCCGPGGISDDGDCENEPVGPLAPRICTSDEAPNCAFEDGTPACTVQPWGATAPVVGTQDLPEQELLYPTQREIHVRTELPYLGTIYKETVGFDSKTEYFDPKINPTFRMFTPYRGPETTGDTVPWYNFHAGEASGTLTVLNRGDANTTAINGNPERITTPFFFPYLGGIQDATQFVRDCLTAVWPNRCTPASSGYYDAYFGKTCSANLSSKMSFYAYQVDTTLEQYLSRVKPTVIQLFDSGLSSISAVKTASPTTEIVGRWFSDKWNQLPSSDYDLNDPNTALQAAQDWFEDHNANTTPDMRTNVNYWVGINEPAIDSPEKMRWLAAFEAERTNLLNGKICIGSFATGTPNNGGTDPANFGFWPEFLPAFQAIQSAGGTICLHEYATSTTTVDGLRMGRFERMYQYLNTVSLSGLQTIISETGATINGAPSSGWRTVFNNDVEEFLLAMADYDRYITSGSSNASKIKGATMFIYRHPGWPLQELSPEVINSLLDVPESLTEGSVQCVTQGDALDDSDSNDIVGRPGSGVPGLVEGQWVDRGTLIGHVGNTGAPTCSTGPHLHFSVIDPNVPGQGGGRQHPGLYLDATTSVSGPFNYDRYAPGAARGSRVTPSWQWPVANPIISQDYGPALPALAHFYADGFHNGLDMQYQQFGRPVYAVEGGYYTRGVQTVGCAANYVVIDHGNGRLSRYWHLANE